ncbi:MAG: ABC transporter permease [Clostridium sp.]|nr:ABC transporter permease [Clostridium sp.]
MIKLFLTELKKIRRRHVGLLYLGALALSFIWALWAMSKMAAKNDVIANQGYYYLLFSYPTMNSVFLPTIIACVESRLCDIELKGNTLKLLCTMQPRRSIYHIKFLVSVLYLLLFSAAQTALIFFLCGHFHVRQLLPVNHMLFFFLANITVGIMIIILQQTLSLLSDNQLFPLFFGVGGTFAGLFSGFFPNIPIRYFLPWGYYYVFTTVNMDYEEASRIVTYYPVSFNFKFFAGFVVFGIIAYLIGKDRFMKKEV